MEEIKRKRGRPRKNKLPEEINNLIQEVQEKSKEIVKEESKVIQQEISNNNNSEWDVPIDQEIKYFDSNLSYELTGYKPISATQSLDFDPSWFTEARDTFNRTGKYTEFRNGSKGFNDFWTEQYKRCKYGMTVNGYTITGDHYFFLNFYRLKDLINVTEAGGGRNDIFPNFLEGQYQWFHYLAMAKKLRLNACMMKARSAGYSEIEAAIIVKSYTVIRGSVNVCCAFASTQLDKLLEKVYANIAFLDNNTDGGFSKGRVIDTTYLKKSGQFRMINGVKTPVGWLSSIQGIVVDKPGKLRGDRTDVLMFEEVGLWPNFTKAYTQSDALVGQIGYQFGIRLLGGTGGESGGQMEGLRNIYYNPQIYGVLPYRHNYTQTGDSTISAFFLPAFKTIKETHLLDNRGWISDEEGRKYFDRSRALKASDPKELVTYCAEFCYNAEEAFSLEGDNKFNKVNIAEQLTRIRALKETPPIEKGHLGYQYKNNEHKPENITGFNWKDDNTAHLQILERPIWELSDIKNEKGEIIWKAPAEPIENLYVIGIDGIDIGKSQTSDYTKDPSDYCITVFKRSYGMDEPKFVALYKDRPNDVREAYKISITLAQYYHAKINIEATRQSIIPWARSLKLLKFFMYRPTATLSEKVRQQSNYKNNTYGTPATPAIIDHQTDLIADYVNDHCHQIWFDEMLDELNRYTDENKGKFDIIASMAMALLADEELSGVVPRQMNNHKEEWQDIGYYTDYNGVKHYGIIPKKQEINISANIWTTYDDERIRTSNPRTFEDYL